MRRVAIVGSGVAGVLSASFLDKSGVDVVLYEKEAKLGGHADTRSVNGTDVDVGFMICNEATYPNLMKLFDDLRVSLQPADMSFSVSIEKGVEWSSRGFSGVFAQKGNLCSPQFWRMLVDIKRFEREVEDYLARPMHDMSATMKSFLAEYRFSESFMTNFLVPMCASIWSVNPVSVMDFPAVFILRFMKNHSLISVGVQRPQWLTITERSKTYIERLTVPFKDKVRLSTSIVRVELLRTASPSAPRVRLFDSQGKVADYHDVIFAAHAPDTLAMLSEAASPLLRDTLSKFAYQNSTLYLHSDTSFMPREKSCWSAWNFLGAAATAGGGVYCSYFLNLLQDLKISTPVIVTLNPPHPPAPHLTHASWQTGHSVPSVQSVNALPQLDVLQGKDGLWFTGAWLGWGFHEDGAKAALDVVHRLVGMPWQPPSCLTPFRCSWPQWAARKLVQRQLSSVIQQGELELWERAGGVMRIGKPVEGQERVRLVITSPVFYTQLVQRGALGFADAWIDGHATSKNLTDFLSLCIRNRDRGDADAVKGWQMLPMLVNSYHAWRAHKSRANTPETSKRNIQEHYDLSNELFATFLDPTMTYSSAIFESKMESLEQAQIRKLETITSKAQIAAHHHVLEIGSGWGSLAIHMARTRGCRVTSLTLSAEQMKLAEVRAKEAGVDDRIKFELIDYRKFAQATHVKFDRIVSCEMLEAVGHEYFGEFFKVLEKLLAKDGIVVIQTIAIADQRFAQYIKRVDFIQERIFHGGCLPCLSVLSASMRDNSRLCVQQLDNYSLHYAHTLDLWRKTFYANIPKLEALGFDGTFQRTWDYYFCYCEAGFRTQSLQLLQLVLSRPGECCAELGAPVADLPRRRHLESGSS